MHSSAKGDYLSTLRMIRLQYTTIALERKQGMKFNIREGKVFSHYWRAHHVRSECASACMIMYQYSRIEITGMAVHLPVVMESTFPSHV